MKALQHFLVLLFSLLLLTGCATPDGSLAFTAPAPSQIRETAPTEPDPSPSSEVAPPANGLAPSSLSDLKLLDVYGEGWLYDFALSPDQKTIAYANAIGLYLVDLETQIAQRVLDAPDQFWHEPDNWPPTALAFSPDGTTLAIAAGNIFYYSLAGNSGDWTSEWRKLPSLRSGIDHLEYSEDGKTMLALSFSLENDLQKVDIIFIDFQKTDEAVLANSILVDSEVINYRLTPEKELLLNLGRSGALRIDGKTAEVLETIALPPFSTAYMSFSFDGSQAIAVDELGGNRSLST